MKICVTADDIQQGQRRDPHRCPVARAVRRAGIAHFGITGMAVMAGDEHQRTMIILPGLVQDWIKAFDYGMESGPFDFELVLPAEMEQRRRASAPIEPIEEPLLPLMDLPKKTRVQKPVSLPDLEYA